MIRITIDVLPDDVLLGVFDFYVYTGLYTRYTYEGKKEIETWQLLVRVCRRWRNLVIGSPRRLNLRLYCTPQTPAKDRLDVWPTFPLIVQGDVESFSAMDNVIAALGHSNRVCQVWFSSLLGWQLEKVLTPMHVSFPELTVLSLYAVGERPVISDSFLGGSAPRLQYLLLNNIPFLGLPKLLLSATHLVNLYLYGIPHSGYISPKEMVASLSVLPCLKSLTLVFRSPQSRPDRESQLPPPKCSILPTLNKFNFVGVTKYLEELVACIDTPQLDRFYITFFNQIDFDFPRLAQFINITPTLRESDEAHVIFDDSNAKVELRCPTSKNRLRILGIAISCKEPDWQLSSIEQVCNSSLPTFSMVEHLYIEHEYLQLGWKNDAIENRLWLEVLHPFTAVKNLYVFKKFAPGIAAALQELVGERMTEVLPSLQKIFVMGLEESGSIRENIGQFVAARQLSNHPIVISEWDGNSDTDWV